MTPVFSGRRHGPWTRVVSACTELKTFGTLGARAPSAPGVSLALATCTQRRPISNVSVTQRRYNVIDNQYRPTWASSSGHQYTWALCPPGSVGISRSFAKFSLGYSTSGILGVRCESGLKSLGRIAGLWSSKFVDQ